MILRVLLLLLMATGVAWGQEEQLRIKRLWLTYEPMWELDKRWTLDLEVETRLNSPVSALWQMRLEPTLEFSLRKWIDLTGGVWLIYTHSDIVRVLNRFEERPTAGVRLNHDIWRGVRLNNYTRIEARVRQGFDSRVTIPVLRLRNRVQAMIPINHKSISEDNTWSALVDAELFWQRNLNTDDVINSRRRYRAGLSWRKNASWTCQFLYGFQQTRINVNRPFSVEHFIKFELIHNIK